MQMKKKLLLSTLLLAPFCTQSAFAVTDCIAQYSVDNILHVPCVSVDGVGMFSAEMHKDAEKPIFNLKETNPYNLQLTGRVKIRNEQNGELVFICSQDRDTLRLECPAYIPAGNWFIDEFSYLAKTGIGGSYQLTADQTHYNHQLTPAYHDAEINTNLNKVSFQVIDNDTVADNEPPRLLSTTPFDESRSTIITVNDAQSGVRFVSMQLESANGGIASSSSCYLLDTDKYICSIDTSPFPVTSLAQAGENKLTAKFEIQDYAGNKATYSAGGNTALSVYPDTDVSIPIFVQPMLTQSQLGTANFSRPQLKNTQIFYKTVVPQQNTTVILDIEAAPEELNVWDYATMTLQSAQAPEGAKKSLVCNAVKVGKFVCNFNFLASEQGGEWVATDIYFYNYMHAKSERYTLNEAQSHYADTEIEAIRIQLDNPTPTYTTHTVLPRLSAHSIVVEDVISPHFKKVMINLELAK